MINLSLDELKKLVTQSRNIKDYENEPKKTW